MARICHALSLIPMDFAIFFNLSVEYPVYLSILSTDSLSLSIIFARDRFFFSIPFIPPFFLVQLLSQTLPVPDSLCPDVQFLFPVPILLQNPPASTLIFFFLFYIISNCTHTKYFMLASTCYVCYTDSNEMMVN